MFFRIYDLEPWYFLLLPLISVNFQLLLAVGTKLEHVITQLAHEVAEKHIAIEGELVVQPSDEHFWFAKPRIILFLIHFILFQNAFEIAFFFWIWVCYHLNTCHLCSCLCYFFDWINWQEFPCFFSSTGSVWLWLLHNGSSSLHCSKAHYRVSHLSFYVDIKVLDTILHISLSLPSTWLSIVFFFGVSSYL